MNVHELIYSINNGQLNQLLPIKSVETETDVKLYSEKGYNTLPVSKFKNAFPDVQKIPLIISITSLIPSALLSIII